VSAAGWTWPAPWSWLLLLWVASPCAVISAGCSVPTDTSPRPGTCDPFQLTDVAPAPDSLGVQPDVTLTLTFNDFPNPDTIDLSTMALYTGFFYHTGRTWVDLVERRAMFQPSSELSLGLGYTLIVTTAVRSLRGCHLEAPQTVPGGQPGRLHAFRFQILEPGADRLPPTVPPEATYDQVTEIFALHCAGSSCHIDGGQGPAAPEACLAQPGGGLSLCGRDAYEALVGVPARQVAQMVRVAPRDSSRSYLLRKLIGAPPVTGHAGSPQDRLSQDDLHVIEGWIDAGAVR
jgi:Bacterial Ig-like domain